MQIYHMNLLTPLKHILHMEHIQSGRKKQIEEGAAPKKSGSCRIFSG